MLPFYKQLSISIILSYGVAASALYLYKYYINFKKNKIPTKWKKIGNVETIILYPLKSGALKEVDEAECTDLGLREINKKTTREGYLFRDRSFVIYNDATKKTISLGYAKDRKVILISVDKTISNNQTEIIFRAPGMDDLTLDLAQITSNDRVNVVNYGIAMDAVDCGEEASQWVSKYLYNEEGGHRLGYFLENVLQRPDPLGTTLQIEGFSSVYKHWRKIDGGVYSHLTSYMIVSSASIEDANSRLAPEDKFSYRHLRPNIVVGECEKYSEDNWEWIKIGDNVIMRSVKLCTRCATITVNPDNGSTNQKGEPLKTLKMYRTVRHLTGQKLQGDLAVMGINTGLYKPGEIHITDPVYVSV